MNEVLVLEGTVYGADEGPEHAAAEHGLQAEVQACNR